MRLTSVWGATHLSRSSGPKAALNKLLLILIWLNDRLSNWWPSTRAEQYFFMCSQLKIYWSIVNIIKYIFQVLSVSNGYGGISQVLSIAGNNKNNNNKNGNSNGNGNFIAQMDSKDRFNAIYSRCLTLSDRLPASYSSLWHNFYALTETEDPDKSSSTLPPQWSRLG